MPVFNKESVTREGCYALGGNEMKSFSKRTAKLTLVGCRHWTFETEPLSAVSNKTVASVLGDERLKKHLQRAVSRDFAPKSLVDSIRVGIRG